MPMIVEAALVTRKANNVEFNTDSVNASGKTWPREIVHGEKGIKAVGTGRNVPYYVLAGSEYKGTAESAVDLFKSCTDVFSEDMSNCREAISEFFTSFAKVFIEAGYSSDECSLGIFCAHDSTVYIAKSGGVKLFRYSGRDFSEIVPQLLPFSDNASSYGVESISHTVPGDIYILINSSVAQVLPDELIQSICKSADGDIKKLISIISAQADKYGCKGAVSAVVIKIVDVQTPAVVLDEDYPETSENSDAFPVSFVENNVEEQTSEQLPGNSDGEHDIDNTKDNNIKDEDDEKTGISKKIAFAAVITIFLLLVSIVVYLGVKGIRSHFDWNNDETTETVTEITSEESETETKEVTEETTEALTTEKQTSEVKTTEAQRPRQETRRENTTAAETTKETTPVVILTTSAPTQSVSTTQEESSSSEKTTDETTSEEESATVSEESTTEQNEEEPSSDVEPSSEENTESADRSEEISESTDTTEN